MHQVLTGEWVYLMSGTPLTLAETASVFGEMLTFRALLDAADPKRRRIMLAAKVEDMLNTVVRQVAFYHFEQLLHDERRSGELVPERIGELWMKVQTESLGPAFEFTSDYKVFWAYVPHFIHTPFYVYAYAFGDCLVNALYSVFQSGHPGFQAKYLAMLRAGGTKRHKELLARSAWMRQIRHLEAADVIAGFIDELRRRVKAAGKVREGKTDKATPPPLAGGGRGEGAGGASLLAHARAMRREAAPAERKLWQGLRKHQVLGLKFRRQVPLGWYIADFYCPSAKLVIEVDGVSHIDAPADSARDAWMAEHKIRVVRVSNRAVLGNLEGILIAIEQLARTPPPPAPLPQGEGESGGAKAIYLDV